MVALDYGNYCTLMKGVNVLMVKDFLKILCDSYRISTFSPSIRLVILYYPMAYIWTLPWVLLFLVFYFYMERTYSILYGKSVATYLLCLLSEIAVIISSMLLNNVYTYFYFRVKFRVLLFCFFTFLTLYGTFLNKIVNEYFEGYRIEMIKVEMEWLL